MPRKSKASKDVEQMLKAMESMDEETRAKFASPETIEKWQKRMTTYSEPAVQTGVGYKEHMRLKHVEAGYTEEEAKQLADEDHERWMFGMFDRGMRDVFHYGGEVVVTELQTGIFYAGVRSQSDPAPSGCRAGARSKS